MKKTLIALTAAGALLVSSVAATAASAAPSPAKASSVSFASILDID